MIKLYFEKLSCFERINEPCTVAIPFPQGKLADANMLCIHDGKTETAVQASVTAEWPDGSVKWALCHFFADLPANKDKTYFCEIKQPAIGSTIAICDNDGVTTVDTGNVVLQLNNKGNIFKSIQNTHMHLTEDEIKGPVLEDAFVGQVQDTWSVIENGSVTARLQNAGKHIDKDGNSYIDFIMTIQVYKNTDWFKMEYKILNKEEDDKVLESLHFTLQPKGDGDVSFSLGKSNYVTDLKTAEGDDAALQYTIDADHLLYESNEHMPEVFYGTFFADWQVKEKGGICATVYQAFQNFPKALSVDKNGMQIDIIPKLPEGITFFKGMAKTHTIFLHLHDTKQNTDARSLQFQMPDRPILEASVYQEADIFPDMYKRAEKDNDVECALIHKFDLRSRAFGMIHFGDSVDVNYTAQGRGNGGFVYTNNEYDFPHAAMLMYARTSERRLLDYLMAGARHWMDVDVCHHSDDLLRLGGMVIHSAEHVSGKIDISHEWVEGLFDYYHMTGDLFAYDTAIGIGHNIKRALAQPRYHQVGQINARETGWALRALVALYLETNDESWLDDASFIVSHFESWKERFGEWLAPYTDHTAIRVPFMIAIAVGSLMRYYKVNPLPKIRQMMIDAVDDMVAHCILDNGLFYYKELPSLRRLGNNTLPLEALTYAYELTGDTKYLEAGIPTFVSNIRNGFTEGYGFKKQKQGNVVITSGQGSKSVAQSFFPVAYFYTAVLKEGIPYKL